jgi:hypothetical protein
MNSSKQYLYNMKNLRFLSFIISFPASFFILSILWVRWVLLRVINTIMSRLKVLSVTILINSFLLNHILIFVGTAFYWNRLFKILLLFILTLRSKCLLVNVLVKIRWGTCGHICVVSLHYIVRIILYTLDLVIQSVFLGFLSSWRPFIFFIESYFFILV